MVSPSPRITEPEQQRRREVVQTIDTLFLQTGVSRNRYPQTDQSGDFAQYSFFGRFDHVTTAKLYHSENPARLVVLHLGDGDTLHRAGDEIKAALGDKVNVFYMSGKGDPPSL